jgi:ATP-dependent DNA helicase RecQ
MKEKISEILNKYFGYKEFRTGQEESILSALEGKNTLVVMPTGSGKSLCYQIPGLMLEGITIVVSPLISLMKDQVDALKRQKIKATFINSSLDFREFQNRIEEIKHGIHKFLYIAPERFDNKRFQELCADLPVSLFVVDEAHCISEWGHDFRPSYRKISEGVKLFNNPVIMALTATATPEVQKDIIEQLDIKNARKIITGFDRPNLSYSVFKDLNKLGKVLQIVSNVAGSGIIYAGTRKNVEMISQYLKENNYQCLPYHAGLKDVERIDVQNKFISDEVKIISATNAFGMGIDKPNIRYVIHYDIPSSIEQYYQEAGRAGRDGKKSYCVLLNNTEDRDLQEYFIYNAHPTQEQIRDLYDLIYDHTNTAIGNSYTDFLKISPEEIHKIDTQFNPVLVNSIFNILEQYGYIEQIIANREYPTIKFHVSIDKLKQYSEITPSKYIKQVITGLLRYPGNMASFKESIFDFKKFRDLTGIEEKKVIDILRTLQISGYLFLTPPIKGKGIFLLQPRIKSYRLEIDYKRIQKRLFHDMKKLDKIEEYSNVSLCRRNFILKYFGENDINSVCGKCDNCLKRHSPEKQKPEQVSDILVLEVIKEFDASIGIKALADLLLGDKESYNRKNRLFQSRYFGIYKQYPRVTIIKMIFDLIEKEFLQRDNSNDFKLTITPAGKKHLKNNQPGLKGLPFTVQKTHELLKKGMTISEIAKDRKLAESTISKHIEELILNKFEINSDNLVSKENRKIILNAINKLGSESLKTIRENIDETISYQDIRLTRAIYIMKKDQNK